MKSPINTRRLRAGLAGALMAGTALSGMILWQGHPANAQMGNQNGAISVPAISQPAVALPGFADLAARVRPAVVTITTTERATQVSTNSPFPPGSEQDQLFRRHFGEQPGMRGQPQRPANALGSGFIVDAEGTVVTNNHVVRNASVVKVKLDDGRELNARVVGRDDRTDIAVLKIDAGQPLPFLALGDSNAARPGDWVVAVGNPFGLGGTVTAGIVSARGRDIGVGPYDDFIQIDAPINSGNSGGPLFGLDGSVIGVNTAIFSPSGGSVGIGFAIPSNMVRQVVAQIQANGRVERGFLGASTQPLTPALARSLRLTKPEGALVGQVEADSPAAQGGLRPGDVVTKVGDTAVANPRDLARAIGAARPGSEVKLSVQRDGAMQELRVTLAELRDGQAASGKPAAAAENRGGPVGVALAPITPQARQQLNLPAHASGAVVAGIRPDSPAAEAGLREGDVIVGVAGRDVGDVQATVGALREAARTPGAAIALRILREGRSAFVAVEMPAQG
ncbi:DegQ family serine endoprotease [Sediminicoccus rosea]|uniref:Probable periplasmic serine endoprotease DegP-like n=1 Tax=Sediminicoccus rosea TaxID=1225128 RepID=A0ABZ0PJQ7_9PROT|nr:DegQ family serine endoprotease [Sediminicoccus rosea]WPB85884.1 DegQ family serine endoprotease [Sediminicoccus rosea]